MLNTNLQVKGATNENDFFVDTHLLRILSVVPVAAIVTFSLVMGMERLVRIDPSLSAPEATVYVVPNPILAVREPPPVARARPEPPAPVELPPELPEFEALIESNVSNVVRRPVVNKPRDKPIIGGYSGNTPIPTVMVQPNYPSRAANKGIEGFVEVQFDVTAMGSTENISVVASQPEKIFDSSALKAVRQWRFKPVRVDGKPTNYKQMVQRLVFEMSKG